MNAYLVFLRIASASCLFCLFYFFCGDQANAELVSGQDLWKSRCVACHETKGTGPVVASHFASVQWTRFIQKGRHKPVEGLSLSEEDTHQLLRYLKAHAADSDHPEIAGVR